MEGFISAVSNITIDMIYEGLPRIPKLGEEVFSNGFDMQIGGGVTASIIALARLGVDARFGTF
jgi:sugar/nucleoside kinase (ribokinase family)